jgi:hypothetical protein
LKQPLTSRYAESERLARARLGLCQDVFTRKAKAKTAPATKEVAVETLLPPAAVMQTTGATLVVPAPTQPKKMTVEEFKAGLARARAKVRVEETKQSEGEMEIPSFLRRA